MYVGIGQHNLMSGASPSGKYAAADTDRDQISTRFICIINGLHQFL